MKLQQSVLSGDVDPEAVVEEDAWVGAACGVGEAWSKALAHQDAGEAEGRMEPQMDSDPWGTVLDRSRVYQDANKMLKYDL